MSKRTTSNRPIASLSILILSWGRLFQVCGRYEKNRLGDDTWNGSTGPWRRECYWNQHLRMLLESTPGCWILRKLLKMFVTWTRAMYCVPAQSFKIALWILRLRTNGDFFKLTCQSSSLHWRPCCWRHNCWYSFPELSCTMSWHVFLCFPSKISVYVDDKKLSWKQFPSTCPTKQRSCMSYWKSKRKKRILIVGHWGRHER